MEEVIENKRRQQIETLFLKKQETRIKKQDFGLDSWLFTFGSKKMTYQKSIPYGAKGVWVEESKKGYTGDALALRGDEGRDKLR